MHSPATSDNWLKRNVHVLDMGVCCFLACVCELQVVVSMWIHPARNYDPVQNVLIPAFILLPILIGFFSRRQIHRLIVKDEMSSAAAWSMKSLLGILLIIVYMGILQFTDVAFHT
jgi:hypothetical protein